jgi:hypothetical protein
VPVRRRSALAIVSVALALAVVPVTSASAAKERPTGRVFLPNPVVVLQDQTLVDGNDADAPVFADAYAIVRLRNLNRSGYLRGDFAEVIAPQAAFSARRRFRYDRSDARFEQVMTYHAVTQAQRYLRALGFTDVNDGRQRIVLRAGFDNSFYDPMKDELLFGKGGVDDAEDMDIIWHEYGHAIQVDQIPGFGASDDALAIGEGFGDFWAFTMSEPVSFGYEPACIGDWDSVTYTDDEPHCLRRVDLDLTVDDRTGSPHHDGQIWSRAFYDLYLELGRDLTTRIAITANEAFAVDTTFAAAAGAVVDAAQELDGKPAADAARTAFADRGIL